MPNMRNFKITISYDGTGFNGWQLQPDVRTVQGVIEDGLSGIFGHRARVIASGRTDTGVHALGQVINVRTGSSIPCDGLQQTMNSIFTPEISTIGVEEVGPDFHARYMAKSKKYVYIFDISEMVSPFMARYVLHVRGGLDIRAMRQCARYLLGEHDFTSFMGAGSSVKTTTRRIVFSDILDYDGRILFIIEGTGFLRHMVRNIAGTLILAGKGKIEPTDMIDILEKRDRAIAGPTAPPHGLYLAEVYY